VAQDSKGGERDGNLDDDRADLIAALVGFVGGIWFAREAVVSALT
jgi:hypothetical protein